MGSEQDLKSLPLNLLEGWLFSRRQEIQELGLDASITWGPTDRIPAAAWLDFRNDTISSRLTVWAGGNAEFVIGDLGSKEVLIEEHRDIMTELGLDDVLRSIEPWLK